MPIETLAWDLPTLTPSESQKRNCDFIDSKSSVRSSFGDCVFRAPRLKGPDTDLEVTWDKGIGWSVVIFMKVLPCAKCKVLYTDPLLFTLPATPSTGHLPICQWKECGSGNQIPSPRSHHWWESEVRLEGRSAWQSTQLRDPTHHIHSAVPLGRLQGRGWNQHFVITWNKIENNRGHLI